MSINPAGASHEAREVSRLDAFSDGVFAIAITLLILTIQVPDPLTTRAHTLGAALAQRWPTYVAYVVSFVFVLIMWINHRHMFRYLARTSHTLLLLNGLLLMCVTIMPFPTALLAEYMLLPDARVAALIYTGMFTVIAGAFNSLWWYLSRHSQLLAKGVDTGFTGSITRRFAVGPALYLTAFGLAFMSVWASLGLTIGLSVYFALPHRIVPTEPAA
ncbi:MAG: DUF1211 domain-containing protein [Ktedonobacterales bacterium]|nr:DUF1211 domain-containing protein [Ktedonobacterales bacterium]